MGVGNAYTPVVVEPCATAPCCWIVRMNGIRDVCRSEGDVVSAVTTALLEGQKHGEPVLIHPWVVDAYVAEMGLDTIDVELEPESTEPGGDGT